MKSIFVPGPAILLTLAAMLCAQSPNAYRQSYRGWRDGDATLEKESSESKELASRIERAAQLSFRHGSDRSAFWRELAQDRSDNLEWLQNSGAVVELDMAPANELQATVMQ